MIFIAGFIPITKINSQNMTRLVFLSILLFFIGPLYSWCQSTFTYTISTANDERIYDCTEADNGNLYFVGRRYYPDTISDAAYFLALDSEGNYLYEHEFFNEDTSSYIGQVLFINDSIFLFGSKGLTITAKREELWALILDNNYNQIYNKTFFIEGITIGDIRVLINGNGNFVISATAHHSGYEVDLFLFEMSKSGDSINSSILYTEGLDLEFDFINTYENSYKVFAYGDFPGAPNTLGSIVLFDSLFNYISADSLPYGLHFQHTAQWLNDSVYLVTGEKFLDGGGKRDIGICKMTEDDQFIAGNHFGKGGDTITKAGVSSNMDFNDSGNIYFGGITNVNIAYGIYQHDSWLILENIDSNLNQNWQRFYGGDAGYYLWALKATADGGCVMMATRYDPEVQDGETDVTIIKVDSNGLLTSTGNSPAIPAQKLAIRPNPASGKITIAYPDIFSHRQKEILIYNVFGALVQQFDITADISGSCADIRSFPKGLYIVVLRVEGANIASGKVVKL
ncbi:MAG: T9SS type A sorting domain-containing protein [Bacteroidales bacterium]|nr:T9SS type A sorting domain-containing protein [Bacteroidales bacterium]